VLVQVVDVLKDPAIGAGRDRDVVEHRQVLDHLAQAHAARVRADGDAELSGQQQDRHVLVDPGHPGRVDVQHVRRAGLQDLLEDHPVGDVLADRHLDRPDRVPDPGQAQDLVRAGRLLNPVRVPRCDRRDRRDRLLDPPALIGVHRDPDGGPDRLPGQRHAPDVSGGIGADLQLDLGEPVADRLPGQLDELVV
jgi:hypothetical protein